MYAAHVYIHNKANNTNSNAVTKKFKLIKY